MDIWTPERARAKRDGKHQEPARPTENVPARPTKKPPTTRQLEARAIGRLNLKHVRERQKIAPDLFNKTKPKITPLLAVQFVKMLSSGLNAEQALDYLFPPFSPTRPCYGAGMNTAQHKKWIKEWADSPLILKATEAFNGGAWEELERDKQIELSLDHLDAQMAYFLYTADYNSPDAPMGKIADARNALMERLKAKDGGDSGIERMMRDLIEGRLTQGPPQLQKNASLQILQPQDMES